MKRLRNYFVMLTVAILALFGTSCSSDDSEELGPFVEYTEAQTFYDTYTSYKGAKALIDTREKSNFNEIIESKKTNNKSAKITAAEITICNTFLLLKSFLI